MSSRFIHIIEGKLRLSIVIFQIKKLEYNITNNSIIYFLRIIKIHKVTASI